MVPEPRLGGRPGGRPSPLRLPSRTRVVAADGDDEAGASGGLWGWGVMVMARLSPCVQRVWARAGAAGPRPHRASPLPASLLRSRLWQ